MAEKTRACESCGETNGHRLDCPTLPDCGCRDDHVSWCPHFKQARAYRSARATETRADATSTEEGKDEQ